MSLYLPGWSLKRRMLLDVPRRKTGSELQQGGVAERIPCVLQMILLQVCLLWLMMITTVL